MVWVYIILGLIIISFITKMVRIYWWAFKYVKERDIFAAKPKDKEWERKMVKYSKYNPETWARIDGWKEVEEE